MSKICFQDIKVLCTQVKTSPFLLWSPSNNLGSGLQEACQQSLNSLQPSYRSERAENCFAEGEFTQSIQVIAFSLLIRPSFVGELVGIQGTDLMMTTSHITKHLSDGCNDELHSKSQCDVMVSVRLRSQKLGFRFPQCLQGHWLSLGQSPSLSRSSLHKVVVRIKMVERSSFEKGQAKNIWQYEHEGERGELTRLVSLVKQQHQFWCPPEMTSSHWQWQRTLWDLGKKL